MNSTGAGTLGPRELARQTGVSPDTLRHYERKGLLSSSRTASGYRRYQASAVQRVQLIQRALVIGFSLDELARMLRDRERGMPPCRHVRELVNARLASLEERIQELRLLRVELRRLVGEWDERLARTPAGEPARLLETLGGRPVIERQRARRTGLGEADCRGAARPVIPRRRRSASS